MKLALFFGLIGLAAAGIIQQDLDMEQEWADYKQRFAKVYRHDKEEVYLYSFSQPFRLRVPLKENLG